MEYKIKTKEEIIGKHVYGNLYGCDKNLIKSEKYLRETIKKAAKIANMKLIDLHSWKIKGNKGGVSVIGLVVESHISIHSWVEYEYATVDVYTCGYHSNPYKAFKYIIKRLKPKKYTIHKVRRNGYKLEK